MLMDDENLERYFSESINNLRHSGYKDEDIKNSFNNSIKGKKKVFWFFVSSLILGFIVSLVVALFSGLLGAATLETSIFALILFGCLIKLINPNLRKDISTRLILSIFTSGVYIGAHFLIKWFLSLMAEQFNRMYEVSGIANLACSLNFDHIVNPIIIVVIILVTYNLFPLIKIGKIDFKKKIKIGK